MLEGRQVAVIGAGIGGLATALAMARRGAKVQVFEQAPRISEVGAGIQITPNGARVLEALGLGPDVARTGILARAVVPVDALTGRDVTRFDLSGHQPAYRFFHRTSLIGFMGRACREAGVELILGTRVVSFGPDGTVTTTAGRFPSDLIVGADGVHSITRLLLGNAPETPFAGQVAWRAVIGAQGVAPEARIWMAPGRHVVTYPLTDGMLNIVAVQERTAWAEDGWNHKDDPANLRAAFSDACPKLREILGHVSETRLWGLFRHPVATRWHNDRAAILGDAAHPTLPFLAQGANLALEDAWVLAAACDAEPDLQTGLARYQALRQGRVARAIDAANANAINYHLSGARRVVAHAGLSVIGKVAPGAFLRRLDWLYGFDATAG